jgi:hypothetical protein
MDFARARSGADQRVIDRIRAVLRSRDVTFDADDDSATFTIDGRVLRRPAVWLSEASPRRQLGPWSRSPGEFVFLADRIKPSVGRRIRDGGGWYADAVGTMYLREPGVLVDVNGWAPAVVRTSAERAVNPSNLMSPGRAQVIFAVLTWPELLACSMRDIGYYSGVSPAAVHKTIALLQDEQYLTSTRRLRRRDELIDLWAAAYPLGLARSTERARLRGEPTPVVWPRLGHQVHVSGEYATPELSGPDLVLYAQDLDPEAVIQSRWRRPAPAEHANIIVRHTFWIEPGSGGREPGIDVAPPLLVYGDLLASNDPRQREIASGMRGDL